MDEILCVIPARGNSKGIHRKNLKLLNNKPLVYYSIISALKSKLINRVVVSTEDAEIADFAINNGAEVYIRDQELSEDNIHSVHVVIDVINKLKEEGYSPSKVVMKLPTSPLVKYWQLDEAIDLYCKESMDSVISVNIFDKPVTALRKKVNNKIEPLIKSDNYNIQRQSHETYVVNAAIYVSCPKVLCSQETFHGGTVYPYVMNQNASVDINSELDFIIAEFLMNKDH